jgi:hypothetical protein
MTSFSNLNYAILLFWSHISKLSFSKQRFEFLLDCVRGSTEFSSFLVFHFIQTYCSSIYHRKTQFLPPYCRMFQYSRIALFNKISSIQLLKKWDYHILEINVKNKLLTKISQLYYIDFFIFWFIFFSYSCNLWELLFVTSIGNALIRDGFRFSTNTKGSKNKTSSNCRLRIPEGNTLIIRRQIGRIFHNKTLIIKKLSFFLP